MSLIVLCFALAGVYTSINVLLVLWRNYKAHQFFKIKTPNLPTLPSPSIFHGHMRQIFHDKNVDNLDRQHAKYGPTFGYFVCERPWVSTKDLDLIKHIEHDQPHKHINRSFIGTPIKEFNRCMYQVDEDQWRKIRRTVSSTLT